MEGVSELKPCPFCGGEAKLVGLAEVWCECQECGCSSPVVSDYVSEDAIKAWNTRYGQTRKCVQCGIEYEPTHPDQKYCSKDCKNAAYVDRSVHRGDGVPPWFAKQFGGKVVEQ